MVILGEIRSDYFTTAQQAWIEKLVSEKGGSFLMLAGHPAGSVHVRQNADRQVAAGRTRHGARHDRSRRPPGAADAGRGAGQHQQAARKPGEDENDKAWSIARPLYDLPRLTGARRGATILADWRPNQRDRASILDPSAGRLAQRLRPAARSMFVATDQLWRLRFKRGDAYHAHFWSQAIQFLTLSRLLGENKRIRLETDRKVYNTNQRGLVQATLLDEKNIARSRRQHLHRACGTGAAQGRSKASDTPTGAGEGEDLPGFFRHRPVEATYQSAGHYRRRRRMPIGPTSRCSR